MENYNKFRFAAYAVIAFIVTAFVALSNSVPDPPPDRGKLPEHINISEHITINDEWLGKWKTEDGETISIRMNVQAIYSGKNDFLELSFTLMEADNTFANAMFCVPEGCFAHPLRIEGDVINDVFYEYVRLER
jgi:hypothetical protein